MQNFENEGNSYISNTMDIKALSGMFRERESAENAYNILIEKGYSHEDINLLMSSKTHERLYISGLNQYDTKAAVHAGKSSEIGSTIGTLAAIANSKVFPELEILVAGPLTTELADAGPGGLANSDLIGGLVSSGIPEAKAKLYDTGIKEGNIVITIIPKDDADAIYLQTKWKNNQGEKIHY